MESSQAERSLISAKDEKECLQKGTGFMTFVTGYISPLCQSGCLSVRGNVQGLQGLGRSNQV